MSWAVASVERCSVGRWAGKAGSRGLPLALLYTAVEGAKFPIKSDTLNCRASPSTSAKIVRTYKSPIKVDVTCQTYGTVVSGSNVWDKTVHDCYVSDYYVKTGKSGIFMKTCPGTKKPKPPCSPPKINAATVKLIKNFEGFVRSPKPDPIGLPTVGYGHLCKKKGCAEVKYKFPLTEATAAALLQDDVKTFTKCISAAIKDSVKLNDNQFGALTSWAFNVGCGAIQSSTLVKRLNKGENPNTVASQELIRWNKAGGRVLEGLTRRRKAEIKLFKTPSKIIAHPPKC